DGCRHPGHAGRPPPAKPLPVPRVHAAGLEPARVPPSPVGPGAHQLPLVGGAARAGRARPRALEATGCPQCRCEGGRVRRGARGAPSGTRVRLPDSPFRGLSAFGESELDALFFFGRERETGLVAANLVASRLTVLYGPSGVGKTSILRAGVSRQLRALPEQPVVVVFDSWK